MNNANCPNCGMHVAFNADDICPSCQTRFIAPVVKTADAIITPAREPLNPYASSILEAGGVHPPNLLTPGVLICVVAVLWFGLASFILLGQFAIIANLQATQPQSNMIRVFVMNILNYSVMLGFTSVTFCGGIAMIRRKGYVAAFLGCCLCLMPVMGLCFGLGFPLGIWGLTLLRRSEVKESFREGILDSYISG